MWEINDSDTTGGGRRGGGNITLEVGNAASEDGPVTPTVSRKIRIFYDDHLNICIIIEYQYMKE